MPTSTEQDTKRIELLTGPDPERMLARMYDLNTRRGKDNGWRFGLSDFSGLAAPPSAPEDGSSYILGLGANLDTRPRTLSEAGLAVVSGRAYSYRNPALEQVHPEARFLEGDDSFEPGTLFWFQLDPVAYLDAENGRTLLEVEEKAAAASEQLAHAHILWGADQNPDWLRAIAEGSMPPVDLGGCRVTTPEYPDGSRAPFLHVYDEGSRVNFDVDSVSRRTRNYAAPVVREFK